MIYDNDSCLRNCIAVTLSLESAFEIVGAYGGTYDFFNQISEYNPDVVILGLKEQTCIYTIKAIKDLFPDVHVIVETHLDDQELILDAVCAGASGYLLNHNMNKLSSSVNALCIGELDGNSEITRDMLDFVKKRLEVKNDMPPDYNFTQEEKALFGKIVKYCSDQMTDYEIYMTELINDVKILQEGGSPMSPEITKKMLSVVKTRFSPKVEDTPDYDLTRREKEILSCIVKGFSHKMTANELYISYETVRSHTKNIYKKLSVGSLSEAVAFAVNAQLV